MSDYDKRDDMNLRHFHSRSQQPKVISSCRSEPVPANIYLVFDQGFGGSTDQIDDTRFKYLGTNPQVSRFERMSGKRTALESVKSVFDWE